MMLNANKGLTNYSTYACAWWHYRDNMKTRMRTGVASHELVTLHGLVTDARSLNRGSLRAQNLLQTCCISLQTLMMEETPQPPSEMELMRAEISALRRELTNIKHKSKRRLFKSSRSCETEEDLEKLKYCSVSEEL